MGLGGPAGFFVGAMFYLCVFFFVGRQQYLKKNSKKPVNPGFSQNIVLNHRIISVYFLIISYTNKIALEKKDSSLQECVLLR